MMICKTCVLNSNFPGIKFNAQGICNHCLSHRDIDRQAHLKEEYQAKFESLIKKYKGKASYDVLVAYSGGKDSSYTLDIFKNKYDLRVLAFTFDNGFISKTAVENRRRVTESLDIDHIIIKPRFDILKKIFVAAAKENLYSRKILDRASSICTSCISFVKFIALRLAIEKEIPFLGFGWSPGQAPIQSSVMKTNPRLMKMTQKALFEPLYEVAGDELRLYFLEEKHFQVPEKFPHNIHPLAFLDYDEEKIYQRITELSWQKPSDTDANSTNCLLNSFANKVHKERYGFHPYAWEIAGIVRSGGITREEGLEKLNSPENHDIIAHVKQRLGIN